MTAHQLANKVVLERRAVPSMRKNIELLKEERERLISRLEILENEIRKMEGK